MILLGGVVALLLMGLSAPAVAGPGTGIIVLADGSAVFADPERNIIWRIDLAGRVSAIVRNRHSHLLRLERGGAIVGEHLEYVSAGSRWRSAFWRLAPGAREPIDIEGPVTAAEPFPNGMSLRIDSRGRAYSWRWVDAAHTAHQVERRHTTTGRVELLTPRGWQRLPGSRLVPRPFSQIASVAFGPSFIVVTELLQVSLVSDAGEITRLGHRSAFPANPAAPDVDAYLKRLWGTIVDSTGAVFVADGGRRQVVRLAPGRPADQLHRSSLHG